MRNNEFNDLSRYSTIYKIIDYSEKHKALVYKNKQDGFNIQIVYSKSDGENGLNYAIKEFWQHYERLRVNSILEKNGEL
jgi:hypothetical protein